VVAKPIFRSLNKVSDYLNPTSWPIKSNQFFLLGLVKITVLRLLYISKPIFMLFEGCTSSEIQCTDHFTAADRAA
jgi:hypothetical protein